MKHLEIFETPEKGKADEDSIAEAILKEIEKIAKTQIPASVKDVNLKGIWTGAFTAGYLYRVQESINEIIKNENQKG